MGLKYIKEAIYLLENEDYVDTSVDIINATPRPINLKIGEKEIVFPKSEFLARVESTSKRVSDIVVDTDGTKDITVDLFEYTYGSINGLPKEKNGVYYIVSAMVLSANKESKNPRKDLISPDTNPNGGAIRDGGMIKAITRFCV